MTIQNIEANPTPHLRWPGLDWSAVRIALGTVKQAWDNVEREDTATFSRALASLKAFTSELGRFQSDALKGELGKISTEDGGLLQITRVLAIAIDNLVSPDGTLLSDSQLISKKIDDRFKDVGAALRTLELAMEQITTKSNGQ